MVISMSPYKIQLLNRLNLAGGIERHLATRKVAAVLAAPVPMGDFGQLTWGNLHGSPMPVNPIMPHRHSFGAPNENGPRPPGSGLMGRICLQRNPIRNDRNEMAHICL